MAQLLAESPAITGDDRSNFHIIQDATQALLALINDLLDFSKLESGNLDLELIAFDFRSTIESAVVMEGERAFAKGLELALHIENNIPSKCISDPIRIRQVLLNLISNAIKFTSEGQVIVSVTIESETDENFVIRFEVADSGIGIVPKNMRKLFRAYQQAEQSTTREYGGTGLGLAISRQLVELLGGTIDVTSTPGEGSTFFFSVVFPKWDHIKRTGELPPRTEGLRSSAFALRPQCLLVEPGAVIVCTGIMRLSKVGPPSCVACLACACVRVRACAWQQSLHVKSIWFIGVVYQQFAFLFLFFPLFCFCFCFFVFSVP